MKVLGIESTAHTFGVGVYDSTKNKILSNEKAYYKPFNEGIVPKKAAEHHAKNSAQTIEKALTAAKIKINEIDAISYSAGPGLGPCLQVGASAASFLAEKYNLPLIPINHPMAHIEIAKWQTGFSNPLILYVSGGNTQIIIENKNGKKMNAQSDKKNNLPSEFCVLGETLDIGIGNLFDSFARELKMEFAHGGMVAQKAALAKKFHLMPYTVKGMNFAFSGLFTYAQKQIGKMDENELCYSLMQTAFCELCEASERALMLTNKKEIIVCGGVAQNLELMKKVKLMAQAHGAKAGTCDAAYNADNGAMIAYTGFLKRENAIEPKDVWADQKWRIDRV
ncbi:MAG: tRNA (adenosine(37)-N6)-threonylcarbamoyltransferase complex transferase subunit TsaD [Candidatus Micrarchaeia archaeon]